MTTHIDRADSNSARVWSISLLAVAVLSAIGCLVTPWAGLLAIAVMVASIMKLKGSQGADRGLLVAALVIAAIVVAAMAVATALFISVIA
ncbi:hypothetical protein LXM50_14875 [Microbacterium sp. Au-Mic1]|uniref:hypothetical protein n=1 Tax=Microbacterium sp. Au-Mic1 TaxID=2906457 RepID=UPI001E53DF6B|nr:hypothetical protein [Microbacterium sp. Au-Mic1]MCE4027256.1 hypothetical protein [Microbacterium sp. Au-Mic1]